jgi:hypothetical protein
MWPPQSLTAPRHLEPVESSRDAGRVGEGKGVVVALDGFVKRCHVIGLKRERPIHGGAVVVVGVAPDDYLAASAPPGLVAPRPIPLR